MNGDVKFIQGNLYHEWEGKWYPVPLPVARISGRRGATGATGATGADGGFIPAVTDASLAGDGSALNPLSLACRQYLALLSQSGTNAPVATVLVNTLGFTPVWQRDSTGYYFIGDPIFIQANTHLSIQKQYLITQDAPAAVNRDMNIFYDGFTNPDHFISILTGDRTSLQDGLLNFTAVEIRVCP